MQAARDPAGEPRRAARPRRRAGSRAPSRPGPRRARSRSRTARASQPSSIASAASDAVPTPASRITGTPALLDDQREVVGVADPHAAADRRAERHDRRAADVLQAPREHRVVVRVGQHDEAVVDELLGGGEQLGRVGQQRALVADDLELDPVGLERLAGELGGRDRVARGEAAGGVRQQLDAGRRRARRRASRAAAGSMRRSATVTISVPLASIASASVSRRVKPPVPRISRERSVAAGDRQRLVRPSRRCSRISSALHRVTTSTRAPSGSSRRSHSPRGTTSASTATATPRAPRSTPSAASTSPTVVPVGELARLAVDAMKSRGDLRAPSGAKRSAERRASSAAARRARRRRSSPVTGASRMPLR